MKIDTKNVNHWWLLIKQALFAAVAAAVRAISHKPKKPIVILYGHQFAGNLKSLYIEWQQHHRQDLDLYFLTLDPEQFVSLKAEGIQTLACHRWKDMRTLAISSIMVTDHGLHAMFPLIHITDMKFIDVWHGIPFKGFVPEDFKLQHRYDEIWVPSERVKKLYSTRFGFASKKLRSLGYARTDKLFRKEISELGFREQFGLLPEQKIVLYAPTWRQKAHEPPPTPFGLTNDDFIMHLGKICAVHDALLVLRCHLNTLVKYDNQGGVLCVPQKLYPDTEDILLATDILVCDWSSISFDFAILQRPTLFLDFPPPFHNGLSLGQEYRFGEIIKDIDDLTNAITSYLIDPKIYEKKYSHKQDATVKELYAKESIGRASRLQVERLIKLARIEKPNDIN
ncbi:CDP-Glycerol:Poly(glycerophosphate) glycerophosphotransferase [Alteromonadaceae bacterium Bs31]|nr:CDP-Glycerol:Poly(glycerophosphate) glycerophosphotransferase [Alteromonadaceae bacterium Bs31]